MNTDKIKCIIEAALLAAGSSLSKERMVELFAEEEKVRTTDVTKALEALEKETEGRGIELVEVATGFRYQARQDYAEWIARLWEERPSRYSRALLETLSLIAYRQPTTRSDIEQVRGVGVSSSIVKTLLEREWIRVVGHRDVPGKPALYATTKYFLDYFGLKSLDELPSLAEIKDLDNLNPELKFDGEDDNSSTKTNANTGSEAGDDATSEAEQLSEKTNDGTEAETAEPVVGAESESDHQLESDDLDNEKSSNNDSSGESSDGVLEEFQEESQEDSNNSNTEDDDSDNEEVLAEEAAEDDSGSSEGEEESDPSLKPTELH